MDLLTPSSSGGLPTLSLTTNSSWLPWGRVAMPLINPLDASTLTLLNSSKLWIIVSEWQPSDASALQFRTE